MSTLEAVGLSALATLVGVLLHAIGRAAQGIRDSRDPWEGSE